MKRETKREMEARHVTRLAKAYFGSSPVAAWAWLDESAYDHLARATYAELRAAVYAVVPGKQKAKNIAALLDAAVTAVCRVIRRRA